MRGYYVSLTSRECSCDVRTQQQRNKTERGSRHGGVARDARVDGKTKHSANPVHNGGKPPDSQLETTKGQRTLDKKKRQVRFVGRPDSPHEIAVSRTLFSSPVRVAVAAAKTTHVILQVLRHSPRSSRFSPRGGLRFVRTAKTGVM